MGLSPGTRLGPYEVTAQIGVGGMGEVYRAHDSRLGRDVAIKVLPPHLTHDASKPFRAEQQRPDILRVNETAKGITSAPS
jgi:serine/threonine protein kinase